jgi:hypothetical protein
MKLNLNINLQSLDGKEIPESNAGKLVANLLAQDNKGDALKKFSMAQKLYNGDTLDLDASDNQMLKTFVEQSESMTVLAKAQILVLFN